MSDVWTCPVIWVALGLLAFGILIGAWCFITSAYGDLNRNEVKLACIGAMLLITGAMCFGFAAALE
jgi:cytochrome bd-type quinol oxidase subunit 2